jgi:fatty-acyl-CoA synthase
VKSGGEWISSVDLENTLMGHPAVKEAYVVGIPHPKWQERPLAAIVLKDGFRATAEELRSFLARSFAKWQLPDGFRLRRRYPPDLRRQIQKNSPSRAIRQVEMGIVARSPDFCL